ncbi:MAG: DNA translocase FtsK [Clostridia bacterium]|nr:DNA translocase FtsK [Clostridia bacterium]
MTQPQAPVYPGSAEQQPAVSVSEKVQPQAPVYPGSTEQQPVVSASEKIQPQAPVYPGSAEQQPVVSASEKVQPQASAYPGSTEQQRVVSASEKIQPQASAYPGSAEQQSAVSASEKIQPQASAYPGSAEQQSVVLQPERFKPQAMVNSETAVWKQTANSADAVYPGNTSQQPEGSSSGMGQSQRAFSDAGTRPEPVRVSVPDNSEQEDIKLNREHPEGSLPSSIPSRGFTVQRPESDRAMQQTVRPVQPVQGQQMHSQGGEQTIVQLREGRLDGTPMVQLKRDKHEPQIVDRSPYVKPSLDLLLQSKSNEDPDQRAKDENGMRKLLATLESFGVQAKGLTYMHGPAITRYEIQPAPGVKVSRIVNLVDDIALNMASTGVRIEAPIPGKAAVGIEVPNESISTVTLRDVLDTPEMEKVTSPTAVALGKGISGKPVIADMAKMPHVLIAGATGSGKSVCINTIINSIIYRASPDQVRLILVDPKVVELSVYNGIPHLLIPVVTDPKKASAALDWAVVEMEHRYKRFESMGVRNIEGYNEKVGPDEPKMYKIIVIIDELADLMMVAPGEVEESICRLAQLARAAGIHLVIATQRPSVNVITGVIKANIPSRIAFAVSSQIDSRTILDSGGAEKLLGKGDMLYAPQGASKPTRVQGCFVSDAEVERIVDAVKAEHQAEYSDDVMDKINAASENDKQQEAQEAPAAQDSQVDEMLAKAIELAVESGQVSISMLQRRLRVGYARAGRLVDEMTLRGITAEAEGPTKPRQVLISREEWKRMQETEGL